MADDLRILFVADVVGQPGREAVKAILPRLKREVEAHLTILNGENSAGGFGLTGKLVAELRAAGADVITTGNDVLVMNLMGRIFTMDTLDDPFRAADAILAAHPKAKIVFCDMHAEATSEKTAMGWYLDGRASAVVGTHTHIPTADARVLPQGTAYVTDVGMVGPRDSCIGMDKDVVLQRFLTGVPNRFVVASGIVTFNSVLVTIRPSTGRATSIQRIDREHISRGSSK